MLKKMYCPVIAHLFACITLVAIAQGQSEQDFQQRIQAIMSRPEFAHSRFGIEFYSLERSQLIYALNEQQFFVPGSTTKLLTEGAALELLGGDYRFRTRVYRVGEVKRNGTLNGNLVLVGAGDPNLSNRIQSDGTLTFENEDHSYGGPDSRGLTGDPLMVIRELAQQIAAKGIKKIEGRVLVDTSLFPEGSRELGTGVVLSPIVVNDNVVDVMLTAGATEGSSAVLQISPKTGYVHILNNVRTGKVGANASLGRRRYENEQRNPDGNWSVTLSGSVPPGWSGLSSYAVAEPSRYAATLLTEALEQTGVQMKAPKKAVNADVQVSSTNYKPEDLVAEHVSPPFKEEVKITLKVSQNLHASMTPSLLGALVSRKEGKGAEQAGFDLENDFLRKAGLDLTGAAQSDGAGGNAFFTPAFIVGYLRYMRSQKDFEDFYRGLPILGRDGTLFKIQVNSPAAGHVHAKTGTYSAYNALNKSLMLTGKGLAGYMETAQGEHLIFACYLNMVPLPSSIDDPEAVNRIAGQALGEIATAAYETVSHR
jgi:PBP4 family serine-type D-alanyl-D-alanine carboxypeptidase